MAPPVYHCSYKKKTAVYLYSQVFFSRYLYLGMKFRMPCGVTLLHTLFFFEKKSPPALRTGAVTVISAQRASESQMTRNGLDLVKLRYGSHTTLSAALHGLSRLRWHNP